MPTASAPLAGRVRVRTIITPDRGSFDWRLRQLWRYRDLIGLFVWRDFISVYKQTILGPTWQHYPSPLHDNHFHHRLRPDGGVVDRRRAAVLALHGGERHMDVFREYGHHRTA